MPDSVVPAQGHILNHF